LKEVSYPIGWRQNRQSAPACSLVVLHSTWLHRLSHGPFTEPGFGKTFAPMASYSKTLVKRISRKTVPRTRTLGPTFVHFQEDKISFLVLSLQERTGSLVMLSY